MHIAGFSEIRTLRPTSTKPAGSNPHMSHVELREIRDS